MIELDLNALTEEQAAFLKNYVESLPSEVTVQPCLIRKIDLPAAD